MKNKLTSLIFLVSLFSFSQNSKNIYYFFENIKITESQYEKLDHRKIYVRTIENDTSTIKRINLHKNIGKLDSIQFKQIKMLLTNIIGPDFNQEKKTLIHLYRENNDSIYKDSNYRKYWRWIKSNSKNYQAFLIGANNSKIDENISDHIYIDKYNFLEKLFFQNSDFNLNHLLIKPNGEIYIYFGLNDILHVLDWSVD